MSSCVMGVPRGDAQRIGDGSAEVGVGDVDDLCECGAGQRNVEQKIECEFSVGCSLIFSV